MFERFTERARAPTVPDASEEIRRRLGIPPSG